MVCVTPAGRVIAHAADFEAQAPGGYELKEAQILRCKHALAYAVMNAYASPVLVGSIERYDAEKLMTALCRNGHTLHTIPIGHEE